MHRLFFWLENRGKPGQISIVSNSSEYWVLTLVLGITFVRAEVLDLNRLFRSSSPTIEVAAACILERDYRTGSNKHCVYDCSGTKTTTTISPDELCPINITQ